MRNKKPNSPNMGGGERERERWEGNVKKRNGEQKVCVRASVKEREESERQVCEQKSL